MKKKKPRICQTWISTRVKSLSLYLLDNKWIPKLIYSPKGIGIQKKTQVKENYYFINGLDKEIKTYAMMSEILTKDMTFTAVGQTNMEEEIDSESERSVEQRKQEI